MTEWKTQSEYNNFLRGKELHISNKVLQGKFKLFRCNYCESHFDDIDERNMHQKIFCIKDCGKSSPKKFNDNEWESHPSASR